MSRAIDTIGLGIFGRLNACAHSCRYCNMGKKRLSNIPRERFAKVVERFIDWRDAARPGFRVAVASQYSDEEDIEEMKVIKRLRARMGPDYGRMHLGGLKMRPEPETRAWLQQRFEAGSRFANASFAGTYDTHDYWNRRPGDFEHLLRLQRTAAEIGFELGQYIFVARSTLPQLESLLDHLEALPKPATERYALLFGYIGWGREQEDDRILEAHRDALPDRVRRLLGTPLAWKSEREWMHSEHGFVAKKIMLRLNVDETNIEYAESARCEDVVADLEARTRGAYELIPAWDELCDRYGDQTNLRLYATREDIERKWLDAYLRARQTPIERELTYLSESL
jgi:hypothetical protein